MSTSGTTLKIRNPIGQALAWFDLRVVAVAVGIEDLVELRRRTTDLTTCPVGPRDPPAWTFVASTESLLATGDGLALTEAWWLGHQSTPR